MSFIGLHFSILLNGKLCTFFAPHKSVIELATHKSVLKSALKFFDIIYGCVWIFSLR